MDFNGSFTQSLDELIQSIAIPVSVVEEFTRNAEASVHAKPPADPIPEGVL